MQAPNDLVDPGFARIVSELLQAGDHANALALAQAGVERYPWYPTGLLMLSRCLEATGTPFDAVLALRRVESLLPDAPVVKESLARLELSQTQSYEQSMVAEEPPVEPPPPVATPPPPVAEPGPASETAAPPATDPGSSVEKLAERLQSAGPIQPDPPAAAEPESQEPSEATPPSIVSPTIAEIFMQQGEYGEALRTYRKIVSQHPDEYDKYATRMEEIEELIRKQFFE